jgi:hypothetical protein
MDAIGTGSPQFYFVPSGVMSYNERKELAYEAGLSGISTE